MNSQAEETPKQPEETKPAEESSLDFYKIQFRAEGQIYSASSRLNNLCKKEMVMVQAEQGLEPAIILGSAPKWPKNSPQASSTYTISRRTTRDEADKYAKWGEMEQSAFALCTSQVEKLKLPMRLVKVERFFSGSKIIFYFTAENRVDFRELVKNLVQEFRTRVEMRQIGVRHETKMLGGMGCCGRELCCSSFIKHFESVSIKMAKAQNLPLNPVKISGACNRLLCCLNYEFKTYKSIKKNMPKIGKQISLEGKHFKVCRHNVLQETILVIDLDNREESVLDKEKWQAATVEPAKK